MKFTYIILLFITTMLSAQQKPKVIEVVENKNVFLYFSSPIIRGISGSSDYIFVSDTQNEGKFGVLKAIRKSRESTLHVVTKDDNVYSFIIRYNSDTQKFTHFIKDSDAIGGTSNAKVNKPKTKSTKEVEVTMPKQNLPNVSISTPNDSSIEEDTYEDSSGSDINFARELIGRGQFYKKYYRKNDDIEIRLSNIAEKDGKSFIFLTIFNDSPKDYEVSSIKFKEVSKNGKSKSKSIKHINSCQEFENIPAGVISNSVYIFNKFSINKKSILNIELSERNSGRKIILPISHRYMNKPNS